MPEHVVHALAGWGFFKGYNNFAISILIGFYAMLCTGKICSLYSSYMVCGTCNKYVLISLGLTKGGKRQGAAESVILGFEPAVLLTKQWKAIADPVTCFYRNPS